MEASNRRKIDRINDMWAKDCQIHLDQLAEETNRHQTLHAKYSDLLTVEKRNLREMQMVVEKFRFQLLRFYRDGTSDPEVLKAAKERGWEIPPEGRPHVKTDLKYWVDTNPDMIEMMMELAEQNDVVELLKEIMTAMKGRGYNIGSAIKMTIHNQGG